MTNMIHLPSVGESLIHLSRSTVNPLHVEEAYLQESSTISSSGHHIYVKDTYYWCPTKMAVVVHYTSGRTAVYGGDDANTLWVALHGQPAYVDFDEYKILTDCHGLRIKIREYTDAIAYDWLQAPPQLNNDQLAEALIRLLWTHNLVDQDTMVSVDEGIMKAAFTEEGLGIMIPGGRYSDAILIMPFSGI